MKIQEGDKVRVNEKGMATDSSNGKAWLSITPERVDQVKHMKYLTVTRITSTECFRVQENGWAWPTDMFEVILLPEEISLTDEDKEFLRKLLQSQIDTCTGLIAKLK